MDWLIRGGRGGTGQMWTRGGRGGGYGRIITVHMLQGTASRKRECGTSGGNALKKLRQWAGCRSRGENNSNRGSHN